MDSVKITQCKQVKDGLDFLGCWFKIIPFITEIMQSFTWIFTAFQAQPGTCNPPI